jgi:HK97 family phage portal protein
MGIFRNIAAIFERRDSTLSSPDAALLALFAGGWSFTGKPVTPQTAFRSSVAAAAIRVISETSGSLPIHIYRRSPDGSRERDTAHPASALLAGDANPWTGASQLRTQIQMDAILHRYGGFIQVIRAGGKVQELHRLPPGRVTPEINIDTGEPQYAVTYREGGTRTLSYTDVIHITTPGATFDRPLSLIEMAAPSISLDMTMVEHQARLFANGGRPSGILNMGAGKKLGVAAKEQLQNAWQSFVGGSENGGRTPILEDGLTFQPLTFNSVDLQFLELRRLTIEEVARVFKVPATLLGVLDRATWRNVEELARQFLQMCLLPWLELWQSALDRALFTKDERKDYFCEFVVDDLLRGDLLTRFVALRNAVGGAWMTANEARRLNNRPLVEGGDELILQAGQTASPDDAPGTKPDDDADELGVAA